MSDKKISEIQAEYKNANICELEDFIDEYISDGRPGVAKIIGLAQKRMEKLRVERERIEKLKEYEKQYWSDYDYIAGIDEVGRGPLAGPVVTACVILPKDCSILYINDSKKLSAAKREELYEIIMEQAVSVSIGVVSENRIDEINILQATDTSQRCGDHSRSKYQAATYYKGRCQINIHRCSQYNCKGHQRQNDGGI